MDGGWVEVATAAMEGRVTLRVVNLWNPIATTYGLPKVTSASI